MNEDVGDDMDMNMDNNSNNNNSNNSDNGSNNQNVMNDERKQLKKNSFHYRYLIEGLRYWLWTSIFRCCCITFT